jgi:hypothetical protein
MRQQNRFPVASKFAVPFILQTYLRLVFFAFLISFSAVFAGVDAKPEGQDSAAQPQAAPKPARKKRHRLRVTKGAVIGISLKADKARMTDIAADLSKRLDAQVILGSNMAKEALTVEFYDLPLEPALRLLAPQVYIDYEIRANERPKVLGVYLVGGGDPDPSVSAVVQGASQAMLIEGNTEDTVEQPPADNDPLQVELDDANLTIKSKKQPLTAVMLTIAEVLSVPAEIRYDSTEIVDTEIKDTPFEDAIPRLSPNIRLYVRADVTRSKRTPLRLVLVSPHGNVADPSTTQ